MSAEMDAASHGFSGWQLLVTSATPTLIVCLLGAVGAAMAHKGVLNAQGCQVVARICFYCFTPALTFGKLVQAVSLTSIAHLWPLLANMTVSIVVGLALGAAVTRLLRTPPEFRVHALVAIAFGNVGNLPLVFVSTLCHDRQALFYRSLGDNCEHLGIAYTAFDIAVATLWQFTLGINMIRRGAAAAVLTAGPAAAEAEGVDGEVAAGGASAGGSVLPLTSSDKPSGTANGGSSGSDAAKLQKLPTLSDLLKGRNSRGGSQLSSAGSSPRDGPLLVAAAAVAGLQRQGSSPLQHPQQEQYVVEMQPQQAPRSVWQQPAHQQQLFNSSSRDGGTHSGNDVAEEDDTAALLHNSRGGKHLGSTAGGAAASGGAANSSTRGSSSPPVRWGRAAWRYVRAVDWGAAFPLPSQAAILGIAVGCVPALKGLLYGPQPPLRVLSEALNTLGSGLIPTTIPLLGAVLYRGPGASRLPLRVTLGVLVTRLVIQPALLTAAVVAALALRLFSSPDAMFLLTLLLSNATPTAINMQTLTVLYKFGEAEMSTILFWQYIASVATLPAYMWLFLRIIDAWL